MHDVQSDEFQKQFLRDLDDKAPKQIVLEMDQAGALALLGNLQLALRHPGNRGRSADKVRGFIKRLIDALGVTPVLLAGLRAGDNPQHDVPRAGKKYP